MSLSEKLDAASLAANFRQIRVSPRNDGKLDLFYLNPTSGSASTHVCARGELAAGLEHLLTQAAHYWQNAKPAQVLQAPEEDEDDEIGLLI